MCAAVGRGPVVVPSVCACCTATCEPARLGSHSGRKVDTTKSTATATVAACAKISQRRYMEGAASIRNSLENLSVYDRNRGHLRGCWLESHTFPALITTPSP